MAGNSQFSVAVHVLTMLARLRDENQKSQVLARSVNTNAVVVRRLLGQLGQAKLVVSQSGANGGSRLARCPEEINLFEVYRAVSCGGVFALPHRSPDRACPVGRNIEAVLCELQKDIERGIGERLAKYTLADVLEMVRVA